MNQTIDIGKLYLDMIKNIPWWAWIVIIVSIISASEGSRRYRNRKKGFYKRPKQS